MTKSLYTKSLRDRLSDAVASTSASKADRALAVYMLAEFTNLPFENAGSLAAKVKVSEPTVGRFCRAIGYDGFKDLKKNLRSDMGDQPWLIKDRLRDLQERTKAGKDQLTRGLELEMGALVAVYEAAQTPEWGRVVNRLATASSVYIVGFQTERGIAQVFTHQLQYLRDKVQLLDLASGNFADLLASEDKNTALVIFEARRYSQNALLLADAAKAAGIPVTLITDPYCDWGHKVADEIFVVPTSFNLFWESTAQMASLANLLVNGVFLELGPQVEVRMNKVARLYGKFTGHVDQMAPHKPKP
ncbi:MurR/RpiR family transcriptional regulator [Sulfitobacter sp.]|uniref:MurR/RpiR family transcriptional regulator n=1 Tax=Sulfitobacter sp. TaxID=1903071 RepID=UPI00300330CF